VAAGALAFDGRRRCGIKKEGEKGKLKHFGGETGAWITSLDWSPRMEGGSRGGAGRGGVPIGVVEQRKGRGAGGRRRGPDEWGRRVSGTEKKKMEAGKLGRCGREKDGPASRLGQKVRR
jgi:hypothetical protein